jgi:3',5'-cyclic AMP phosphodiesterase CpdA
MAIFQSFAIEIHFAKPPSFSYRRPMRFIPPDKTTAGGTAACVSPVFEERPAFSLVHFSDPHIACTDQLEFRHIMNKRLLGYLRWKFLRGAKHQEKILNILKKDLQGVNPDHILITGDLTHLSLVPEFRKARAWLQSLGGPSRVSVIPGNHDAYVRTDWERTFACWRDYMDSDTVHRTCAPVNGLEALFPTLRVRGQIALIGISTAHPCAPHLATGRVGTTQLSRLEKILKHTGDQNLLRIIAIHHPPVSGIISRRKRLTDASALRGLLASRGAELVLHGHTHKATEYTLPGPSGVIPVLGAPSASSSDSALEKRACYYLHCFYPSTGGWTVSIREQVYSNDLQAFIPGGNRLIPIFPNSIRRRIHKKVLRDATHSPIRPPGNQEDRYHGRNKRV